MKAIVVYESKYGSTKKYAEWLADSLACELYERKAIRPEKLREYDIVVYGGGLYAGGVSGIRLLIDNFEALRHKNLVLFTCGLADPTDAENVARIRAGLAKALAPQMLETIKVFHLRGGIDYAKLGPVHKTMMAMLCAMTKKKGYDTLRNEEKEMLDTYGKIVDFSDRATTKPILDYIAGL